MQKVLVKIVYKNFILDIMKKYYQIKAIYLNFRQDSG